MFCGAVFFERTYPPHTSVLTLSNYFGFIANDDSSDFLEGERMNLEQTDRPPRGGGTEEDRKRLTQ